MPMYPFNHDYHLHVSFMELGHLLTRSGLTYPEVSSKVYHDLYPFNVTLNYVFLVVRLLGLHGT